MKEHKIRRLPVIDDKELVGVVSIADLAGKIEDDETGHLVETISAASSGRKPKGSVAAAENDLPNLAAPFVEAVESTEALDQIGARVGGIVRGAIPAGPVGIALSGAPIGHALHPLPQPTS